MEDEFHVQAIPLSVLELFCWNITVAVLSKIYKCSSTSKKMFCISMTKSSTVSKMVSAVEPFDILADQVSAGVCCQPEINFFCTMN